ncbi:phospho-sugar mutase [uncultured Helcococcus sp.]|uniref:phospho-sugar mutase n=1 Tax=uncultured Helcococcus sp. TaxID=1072508 RepID=UPI00262C55B4|nr:phospho-sugar mutase [uncultured Helcococcus sp.]
MDYMKKYQEWLDSDFIDAETKEELKSLESNKEEIQDRFYQDLKFGTAGLRGKIGAGTNRMNRYTVALATQGLAQTIIDHGKEAMEKGVAISYDVRHKSDEFAKITAEVLAANGIKVYTYDQITPTPVLSYTIRHLGTISGVMITASHNPREYNGYKAYWDEGAQILDDIANEILENISKVGDVSNVKSMDFDKAVEEGLITILDYSIVDKYMQDVLDLTIEDENIDKDINVVYSPLNGCGNKLVRRILDERGFKNIHIVKEQENPDPDFTTVGYPNPEDPKAFKYAIELGNKVDADILIATDPDADRVAVEVKNDKGEYTFLSGNETGSLLTYYILSRLSERGELPENGAIVKSIVSTDLPEKIADKFGVAHFNVLTGFKNIYAKANEWDKTGEYQYIFGFEDAIGYSYGDNVRDKDAISSSMMVIEMAAYYKSQGKTLLDVQKEIYEEFGYHAQNLNSVVLEGLDGQKLIARIMEEFRVNPIEEINGIKLESITDYLNDETGLEKQNCLGYKLEDGSWYILRPSGTEPKIKLYIYSNADTAEKAQKMADAIFERANAKILAVE